MVVRVSTLLLFSILIAPPVAAKRAIVVTDHRTLQSALEGALTSAGYETVSGTRIHGRFFGLVFNIEQPPPGEWPVALNEKWDQGTKACVAMGNGKAFNMKNTDAWLCSRDLAVSLWQLYLDHEKADTVVVANARETKKGWEHKVAAYDGSSSSRWTQLEFSRGRDPSLAVRMMDSALMKKGTFDERPILRAMPQGDAVHREMFKGKVIDLDVSEAKKRCKRVRHLRFSPEDAPIAKTMQTAFGKLDRVTDASGGSALPEGQVPCVVKIMQHSFAGSRLLGGRMQSYHLVVTCTGEPSSTVRQTSMGIHWPGAQRRAAEKILPNLIDEHCVEK
jgi:hypothetical protein